MRRKSHRRSRPIFVSLVLVCLAVVQGARADVVATPDPPGVIATPAETAIADRVMHAFDLLGTPYHKGGSSPQTGFDCSGFIGWIFHDANGVTLPRSARGIYALRKDKAAKVDRDALAPGDLVFFHIGRLGKRVDHIGMFVGEGRFVHAPASGGEVRVDPLDASYWTKHYAGARRILLPPVDGPAALPDDGLAPDAAIGKDAVSMPVDNNRRDGAAAAPPTNEEQTP